jgi:hypothetical protein
MKNSTRRILFWTPRIICILFAVFISLFALDVFEENTGFWQTTLALVRHLIPTALIVFILVVSWRWEWVGAVLFCGLGAFYIWWAWGKFPLVAYFAISGPLFVVGVLFLFNWLYRAEIKARS